MTARAAALGRPPMVSVAFGAVVMLLAASNARRFGAAGHDDTFIMLWSGRTFSVRDWFVNFNGQPEEISSSWLAAWMASLSFWLSPEGALALYKIFGALAGAGVLAVLWSARSSLFPSGRTSATAYAFVVGILTLLSTSFAYWVHGGLETPYQALLVIAWVVAAHRHRTAGGAKDAWLHAVVLCLLVLVRTEGFWLLGAAAFMAAWGRGRGSAQKHDAFVLCGGATFFVATLVLRRTFTGAFWPNPVYAKLDGTGHNLERGLQYLAGYYTSGPLAAAHAVAVVYAAVVLAKSARSALTRAPGSSAGDGGDYSPALVAAACVCVGQDLFALASGGNWMEYYRFMAPTVALKGVVLAHLLDAVLRSLAEDRVRLVRAVTFALLGACALEQHLLDQGTNGAWHNGCLGPMRFGALGRPWLPSIERELLFNNVEHARDERDLRPFVEGPMGKLVTETGGLRIATYQMGYFPFLVRKRFSAEQVMLIDTHGLNDRYVALVRGPKNFFGVDDGGGLERVAAGLSGELSRVVLARAPNVFYGLDASPAMRSQMNELGYEVVWDQPGAKVFFRRPAR